MPLTEHSAFSFTCKSSFLTVFSTEYSGMLRLASAIDRYHHSSHPVSAPGQRTPIQAGGARSGFLLQAILTASC